MTTFPAMGDLSIPIIYEAGFPKGYVIPFSGTISAEFHPGIDVPPEVAIAWRSGDTHALGADFIAQYYNHLELGSAIEIVFVLDDQDCIGGVRVTARGRDGFDYTTYSVWESGGRLYAEQA